MVESLGLIGESGISSAMHAALSDFLQALIRESERHTDEMLQDTDRNLRWPDRWHDRNVMDLSEYEIIHPPLDMDEGVENQSMHTESSTRFPENVEPEDIAMGDRASDEEVVYTEWSLSSPPTQYHEGIPNVQTPITPWQIHAVDEIPAQEYTWKAVREAILRRREERMLVRFQRMPGLIRVIWDAHWEAHQHGSPACTRLGYTWKKRLTWK
ncbi:hypothetical protein JVT61DRAFT_14271 [Boletus reticuloceps]|uniref:Uncharacterized protein n=1 Tax=Boletus reticuloceps TaxID=495285 RepID=A0A8I3A2E3_9AGAM|nr:hypothetical protein JVT61DRAFT_14267 [Boletus reticuloceps]KAG6369566.1 hypothetical protein JVT61DRAFT_14271 [Boletus reticuloceps]